MPRKIKFTLEEKEQAVIDYLDRNIPGTQICEELCMSSRTIRSFKKLNQDVYANRELKDYNPKQEVYMTQAQRKTTLEERKEIVDYCT